MLAIVLLVPVVLVAMYLAVALSWSYSEGQRAGYLQKFSRKGWVCKTWEGEIAMANLPGAMPQIFEFSVRDDAVANEIQKLGGQRVSLGYEEHPGIPTTCFGDTAHFIVKVTPITDAAPLPATPPPPAPAQ